MGDASQSVAASGLYGLDAFKYLRRRSKTHVFVENT
tara:strand:+ start:354 stop:461 length:108 start_codon:yes stop_codon:yes gene_type:complete